MKKTSQRDTGGDNSLNKSLHELQALNKLAQMISSTLEPDKIIRTVIEVATDLSGARQGSILLTKEPSEARFTTLIRKGSDPDKALLQKACMIIAGWVLRHQTSVVANDVLHDPRFRGLELLGYRLQSVIAVPILARGSILGVLILHSKDKKKKFTDSDLRILTIIASQSAPVLENAEEMRKLREENRLLKAEIESKYSFDEIVGRGTAMRDVLKLLEKVIPTDARILIYGESGTGKELIARAIHHNGPRQSRRFVGVDCGALPENLLESELFGHVKGAFTGATESKKGLFLAADGGTLFLDEIMNTSPALQAKLLRAIQEGEIRPVGDTKTIKVNVRIIAACSEDLGDVVKRGEFREDLYFRLKVVTVVIPPLRERPEDIPVLANHFLKEFCQNMNRPQLSFSRQALTQMARYHWPGNVRELENAVERCVTLAEPGARTLDADLLPDEIRAGAIPKGMLDIEGGTTLMAAVEALEQQLVREALRKYGGNRTRAAEMLGLSRRGLLNKIRRYGLPEKS